jgi:hypothetical protein
MYPVTRPNNVSFDYSAQAEVRMIGRNVSVNDLDRPLRPFVSKPITVISQIIASYLEKQDTEKLYLRLIQKHSSCRLDRVLQVFASDACETLQTEMEKSNNPMFKALNLLLVV